MSEPVSIRLDLNHAAIRHLLTGETEPVVKFIRRVARDVRNRAVLHCPVDTGLLRQSLTESVDINDSRVVAFVGTDVPYAIYVHEGTRPHLIRPRRPGGALRFTVGGQVVFAKYARHPGTKPNPFLRRAVEEVAIPRGFIVRR